MTPIMTPANTQLTAQGGVVAEEPEAAAAPAPPRRAAAAPRRTVRRLTPGRLPGLVACAGLMAVGGLWVHLSDPARLPVFLFCAALALLATLLPATGPHGQRVGLLPAVGLASLLLLPLLLALPPVLLANLGYALTRETRLSRRLAHERGVCLALAGLAAGLLQALRGHSGAAALLPNAEASLPDAVGAALLYSAVFMLGRGLSLGRHSGAERTVRRHAFLSWRLEAVTLAATAPVAVLTALAFPDFGLLGVSGAAALFCPAGGGRALWV